MVDCRALEQFCYFVDRTLAVDELAENQETRFSFAMEASSWCALPACFLHGVRIRPSSQCPHGTRKPQLSRAPVRSARCHGC